VRLKKDGTPDKRYGGSKEKAAPIAQAETPAVKKQSAPNTAATKSYTPTVDRTLAGPNGEEIITGPRGGKYYINKNGNKTYLKKQ
jgi:colicin import membrane protein